MAMPMNFLPLLLFATWITKGQRDGERRIAQSSSNTDKEIKRNIYGCPRQNTHTIVDLTYPKKKFRVITSLLRRIRRLFPHAQHKFCRAVCCFRAVSCGESRFAFHDLYLLSGREGRLNFTKFFPSLLPENSMERSNRIPRE